MTVADLMNLMKQENVQFLIKYDEKLRAFELKMVKNLHSEAPLAWSHMIVDDCPINMLSLCVNNAILHGLCCLREAETKQTPQMNKEDS